MRFVYIDTGAMYRAVTYIALKNNIAYEDEKAIAALLQKTVIRFEPGEVQQVFVGSEKCHRSDSLYRSDQSCIYRCRTPIYP